MSISEDARRRPEEGRPLGDDHASVVRVSRYERPVRYDLGPNVARAAARAAREDRLLGRGRLLLEEADQDPRLARLRVPESLRAARPGARRRSGRASSARIAAVRLGGQGGEPAVGVEHRRQREDVRDAPAPPPRSASPAIAPLELAGASPRVASSSAGPADRHDQLDQADPAEPRLDGAVVPDDPGLGLEGVDVVRLVRGAGSSPRSSGRTTAKTPTTIGHGVADDPGGQPVHRGRRPARSSRSGRGSRGGTAAASPIGRDRQDEQRRRRSVQTARIAPNCRIGTTSLVTRAP